MDDGLKTVLLTQIGFAIGYPIGVAIYILVSGWLEDRRERRWQESFRSIGKK